MLLPDKGYKTAGKKKKVHQSKDCWHVPSLAAKLHYVVYQYLGHQLQNLGHPWSPKVKPTTKESGLTLSQNTTNGRAWMG